MALYDCFKLRFKCADWIRWLQSDIENHYGFLAKGLPTMEEMIKDGRAKPFTTMEFFKQFEKQTGRELKTLCERPTDPDKETQLIQVGQSNWRLPQDIFKEIIIRSSINKFKYQKDSSRKYICGDFSFSLFCEMQIGYWWDVFIGLAGIPGHQLNLMWFSDKEEIQLFEPQTDLLISTEVSKVGFLLI